MFVFKDDNINWAYPMLRGQGWQVNVPISDAALKNLPLKCLTVSMTTATELYMMPDPYQRKAEKKFAAWQKKYYPETVEYGKGVYLSRYYHQDLPVMMATHTRLGEASPMSDLDPGILRLICQMADS